jgi:PAS domain S-box-containing protein
MTASRNKQPVPGREPECDWSALAKVSPSSIWLVVDPESRRVLAASSAAEHFCKDSGSGDLVGRDVTEIDSGIPEASANGLAIGRYGKPGEEGRKVVVSRKMIARGEREYFFYRVVDGNRDGLSRLRELSEELSMVASPAGCAEVVLKHCLALDSVDMVLLWVNADRGESPIAKTHGFEGETGDVLGQLMKEMRGEDTRMSERTHAGPVTDLKLKTAKTLSRYGWRGVIIHALLHGEKVVGTIVAGSRSIDEIPTDDVSFVLQAALVLEQSLGRLYAEQTAATAELQYHLLAEHLRDMLSRHDADAVYLYVSPACRTLLGYEPEDLLGHSAYEFIHPEDIDVARHSHDTIMKQPIEYFVQYRIRRKDGSYTWFETASESVTDPESGEVTEIIALSRDISQRKQAERALKKSEERYRNLVEGQTDLVCRARADGALTFVNDAYCACFGLSRDEIIGQPLTHAVPDEDYGIISQAIDVLSPKRPHCTIEHRALSASGQVIRLQWAYRAFFDRAGKIMDLLMVGRDVTQRRQAEQALLESRERLNEAQRIGRMGYWELRADSGELIWSDTMYELFERDRSAGPPSRELAYQLYTPERQQALRTMVKQLFETGEEGEIDVEVHLPSGKTAYHNVLMRAVKGDDGQVVRLVGTVLDITERKHAERALEEKNVALRHVLQQIDMERREVERAITANINKSVVPLIRDLAGRLDQDERDLLKSIENTLEGITSRFLTDLERRFSMLTPRELEICAMIKNGMGSKEIANVLNLSVETVHKFRNHIRRKLGLTNEKINLQSFLQTRARTDDRERGFGHSALDL